MVNQQPNYNHTLFSNENIYSNNNYFKTNKFYNKKITHQIPKNSNRKGSKQAFAETTNTDITRKAKHESELGSLKHIRGNKI